MKSWPKHPVIYEINTWVWLSELSRKYKRPVNLATVSEEEWDALASHGFDAVWFSDDALQPRSQTGPPSKQPQHHNLPPLHAL
jgi:hypothetical protein